MNPLRLVVRLLTLSALAVVAVGCGKRGPPLAPLLIVPDRVSGVSAQRFADQVYIRFQIPSENTDGRAPADLDRVEIYALTNDPAVGRRLQPSSDEWLDAASLVATVSVQQPIDLDLPATDPDVPAIDDDSDVAEQPAQGDQVTVVERLTQDTLVPVVVDEDEDDDDTPETDEVLPDAAGIGPLTAPPLPRVPRRTYAVVGVSTRGRESRTSSSAAVSLVDPPLPPAAPAVTYTEDEVVVVWQPPPTAKLPVQQPASDLVLPSEPIIEPLTPSVYEVYEVAMAPETDESEPAAAVNAEPLMVTTFADTRMVFGVERCYAVRIADTVDSLRVYSQLSASTCVILTDTFPPAPPDGLIAVASEGAISLVWDPSAESDVAGYLVLRGRSPAAALEPLNRDPVEETTYRDTDVEASVSYIYSVQAVDRAVPANLSLPSERVMEQAR